MDVLEKKITGDWFDIREKSSNLTDLEDYFAFSIPLLGKIIDKIRLSVEGGIIEYKRSSLLQIFSRLESLKYDSKSFENLPLHSHNIYPVIYVTLIQKLLATGVVPLKENLENHESNDNPDLRADIKTVIKDVQMKILENPELKQRQEIKNILMQITIYKKELENMKKISQNILPEKAKSFYSNFKKTFAKITHSIVTNYSVILKEEEDIIRKSKQINILKKYEISALSGIHLSQAKEIARLHSTINFAIKEKYKTRELLIDLVKNKDIIMDLISKESDKMKQLAGNDNEAILISKAFGHEIIYRLNRQLNKMT